MSTLHDIFEHQAGSAGTPELDIDELIGHGEHRLLRRRLGVVFGAVAAVILAVAITMTPMNGAGRQRPGPPVNHPPPVQESPTRQILYSDVDYDRRGDSVQFGDRRVRTGNDFVHMDVTDAGFVYTDRGAVWFSNGGAPKRIGSHVCGLPRTGDAAHFANRAVITANNGSTVAWSDCSGPAPRLVVFDTSTGQEVARRPMRNCALLDITEQAVYLDCGGYVAFPRPEFRFDLATGRLSPSSTREYAADLRSRPRGLVIGDSWQTGSPTDGIGQRFRVEGSRLVPLDFLRGEPQATSAFDTATHRPVRLRLPVGHHVEHDELGPGELGLFEWLDDDTAALVGPQGEILTCHLSTGSCVVSVQGPRAGEVRVLPYGPLPG